MKALAGLSLLGLLLALAWVLIGQIGSAERVLKPGTTLAATEATDTLRLSPAQRGLGAATEQAVAHMLQILELDYLSAGNQMTSAEMLASLNDGGQELGAKVAIKAAPGVIIFRQLGPSRLALCDQATGNWHCLTEDLATRERSEAYGGSLKAALTKAVGKK